MKTYRFELDPVPKPRMTQADKWKKRKTVVDYWEFKKLIRLQANLQGMKFLPVHINAIDFHLPMPKTWSKKKRAEMDGQLHTSRPDLDNLLKGLQDALCSEDSHIAQIDRLSKTWSDEPLIKIEF
ncbi:MAG: RusA family crossover junction endodeoxyribonuclease [Bacteroidales bacterium]|jgi:Holliday junction resolvase RusA-like endonuclease